MATNLAGKPTDVADEVTSRELRHARIEIVAHPSAQPGEVRTRITGKLGMWTFERLWYYWSASGGKMPIVKARELWSDPLGKDDVRVGGHCGCPSPDEYGSRIGEDGMAIVDSYHIDSVAGLRLFADAVREVEEIK